MSLVNNDDKVMKGNTSMEEMADLTPSKKKLKQARLPFKIISEGSPVTKLTSTRKRKLSSQEEAVAKIGKISKENEVIAPTDLVVISDEDSRDVDTPIPPEDKPMNPYLKIVDKAWKKKNRKLKTPKKRKINNKPDKDVQELVVVSDEPVMNDKQDQMQVEVKSEEEAMHVDEAKIIIKEDNELHTDIDKDSTSSNVENSKTVSVKDLPLKNSPVKVSSKSKKQTKGKSDPDLTSVSDKSVRSTRSQDDEATNKIIKDTGISPNKSEEQKIIPSSKNSPKRTSVRNKKTLEAEDVTKMDTSSNNLDESQTSLPSTPKTKDRNLQRSETTESNETLSPANASLTPKQIQRKLESAKKRDEREKERVERDKKKQQEKEERAKLRQEKEDQKKKEREEKEELKKKEREEKEEQRKKEKEEKDKLRELEKKEREEKEEQKRKEREEKEEQKKKEKEAKEEEKRKRQEAVEEERKQKELEKIEQENKKKKAAAAFVNFFLPKQKVEKDATECGPQSKNSLLSSFMIKNDMRLAPTVRCHISGDQKESLDQCLQEQECNKDRLYVKCLKNKVTRPKFSEKTWPLDDKNDDDVMIVESEDDLPLLDGTGEAIICNSAVMEKLRPKLLSFHENKRPPYWGTWRKRSKCVTARRPFKTDQKQLDYEVDSEEEWEEEEGESIGGSVAGSEEEPTELDEYEVDNEFFVPHGYLSDEEATMEEDDMLSLSPESQKLKLKYLEDEFESEMKKPTEKLKPRLYGLLWENKDGGKPDKCVDALWKYFGKLTMIMNDPTPLLHPSAGADEVEKKKRKKKSQADGEQKSPKNAESKKKAKAEKKEGKKAKVEVKKNTTETKKNQPGINAFLTKIKTS